MIVDRQIAWTRQRYILRASEFQGASVSGSNYLTELTNSSSVGLKYQGTVWDGSDSTGFKSTTSLWSKFLVPYNWNPEFPLGVRVHYFMNADTSASNNVYPIINLQFKSADGGTPAAAAVSTALDTPIPTKSLAAALTKDKYRISNRGIKNAGWSTRANIYAGLWAEFSMTWNVTGYALNSTTQRLWVPYIEFDYVPMLTRFPHQEIDSPLDDTLTG